MRRSHAFTLLLLLCGCAAAHATDRGAAVGKGQRALRGVISKAGASAVSGPSGSGCSGASSSGGARELLAKKPFFYWKSPLPLNRPASYPADAKYTLEPGVQQSLPKLYIPKGSQVHKFEKLQKKYRPHSFRKARATFYGLDPKKGDSIDVGSCGYSYINKGEACGNNCLDTAALSDANKEYPRSCGRCYEIGCQPAVFTDGNQNLIYRNKACRNPSQTLVVRITDTCPCSYPNNAFSNKRWCCGDGGGKVAHFDLSVQAFEKLAEPGLGVIALRHRIVPCWYQPKNPAVRPKLYHAPNAIPSWVKNEHRGWNWTAHVAGWVTKQRQWPDPLGPGRGLRPPANVTGARVTGYIPINLVEG